MRSSFGTGNILQIIQFVIGSSKFLVTNWLVLLFTTLSDNKINLVQRFLALRSPNVIWFAIALPSGIPRTTFRSMTYTLRQILLLRNENPWGTIIDVLFHELCECVYKSNWIQILWKMCSSSQNCHIYKILNSPIIKKNQIRYVPN